MPVRDDQSVLERSLEEIDPEISQLIGRELERQRTTLDLVASESVPPRAVLEAQGSILSAKYADGFPGRRDYDLCGVVDEIESLAIERAKSLFCAEHANVQPYSGSNANFAVLHALCEPGDSVLGWDFEHGGHETHYFSNNFAGRFFRTAAYGVRREDRLLDMDEVERLARAHRPKVIFAGWSCYPRWIDFRRFREICDEVGAYLVVDMAHFAGLVAAGQHPDPVPYADACTMTVHKTLGGARGGAILCRADLAERIDAGVYPGEQGGPLEHVVAAKAVTFALCDSDGFRQRMERTIDGARAIAEALLAAEEETKATVVTGGTDVHQLLVDLGPSGRLADAVMNDLNAIGISANAMRIAYDEATPPHGSGLRFGASALAARGFGKEEFAEVGAILAAALAGGGPAAAPTLAGQVRELLSGFPLFSYL